jgi:hypothetical protein
MSHRSRSASSSSRRISSGAIGITRPSTTTGGVEGDDMIDVEIREEHTTRVLETEDHFKAVKTVQEHNRRLMQMIEWTRQNYPAYAERGIIELNDDQKRDAKRYYKSTHDFKYQSLNPQIIKAFLSDNKFKPNAFNADGKPIMYSFTHMRKFQDAILFGALRAKTSLPERYLLEMKSFLDSKKKETTKAKKRGEVEEYEADPISFELYRLLCKFAIDEGDIFTWAYTVVQWHCMARSASIDDLTFLQLKLGTDSIVVEYDDSKADQKGERTTPKNCFANPFDFLVCFNTALGCYFCVADESWDSEKSTVFRNKAAKDGSASHRYCDRIKSIYHKNKVVIEGFVRPRHFNPHGTRKGAAIRATSGTTLPASLPAIANRGEWTVSMLFEVYLGFAEPGDQYLGRLLAGLEPNKASFACIPPHFKCGMENRFIKEAMELCFGGIMSQTHDPFQRGNNDNSLRQNVKAVLLRCLASIVHHSNDLKECILRNPGHPFINIPILRNENLLGTLKNLVTLEKSDAIQIATGVPPHVETISMLETIVQSQIEDRAFFRGHFLNEIKDAIADKCEEIAQSNGQLSRSSIESLFETFQKRLDDRVNDKIDELLTYLKNNGTGTTANADNMLPAQSTSAGSLFAYDGKFWMVPKDFEFPRGATRRRAWELWLCGMTVGPSIIPPFRTFKVKLLPERVRNVFKTQWLPILSIMQSTPSLQIPLNVQDIDSKVISESYAASTEHCQHYLLNMIQVQSTKEFTKQSIIDGRTTISKSILLFTPPLFQEARNH